MTHRLVPVFVLLALSATSAGLHAQTPVASPISWTSHTLQSTTLGTERTYLVSLPASYATSEASYPVLVILDADDVNQFTAAIANTRFLSDRGEAPEMIVVGVRNGSDRTHDLAPMTKASGEVENFPTAGGVDKFVTFIHDEVLAAVRKSYRASASVFLAGHSFGGLTALHSAARRPDVFNGVIAISPSLQWNDTKYVVEYADLLAKQTEPNRVFVSSGGLEPPIDINTQRFAARMDSLPHAAVALRYERYPEDNHSMTPQSSLIDGVRFLFEPVSLRAAITAAQSLPPDADSAAIVKVMEEVEVTYAEGARSIGLSETLPEAIVNQFGYMAMLQFTNPQAAVAIFRKNVSLYPGSANVYDSLGDGLLAANDKAGARAAFAKAVEVAKATGHSVLTASQQKLEALQ